MPPPQTARPAPSLGPFAADPHSLAWTCRQHLAQAISRLVPSSPMEKLAGSGSVFSALEVKHISGISGRVFWPLLEGGVEGPSPSEDGGASFSVCRACKGDRLTSPHQATRGLPCHSRPSACPFPARPGPALRLRPRLGTAGLTRPPGRGGR